MWPNPETKRMCIVVFGHSDCGKTRAAISKLVELNWPFRFVSPTSDVDQQTFLAQVARWDGKSTQGHHRTYPQILIFEGGDKAHRFKKPKVLGSDKFLELVAGDNKRASAILAATVCKPLGSGKVRQVKVLSQLAFTGPETVYQEMEKFNSFFFEPRFPDTTGLEELMRKEDEELDF